MFWEGESAGIMPVRGNHGGFLIYSTTPFGHTLLGMAYATVVVQSRLQEMSPQLEEAAQDLGCRPWQVFFLVTLPLISQAIASAWLLSLRSRSMMW